MKGTNLKRVLLVSSSVILLCMSIIIGSTWAIFTDQKTVINHLQAGDLDITLKRIKLTKTALDGNGYLSEFTPDEHVKIFTRETDENIFGIGDNEKIVPGSKYSAEMRIVNNSDVAFGYWLEIKCTDKTNGEDLSKQIKITVDTDTTSSAFIGEGLTIKGANGGYIDELVIGEAKNFTVTIEFLDSFITENGLNKGDNDLAQNENLTFDLIVHAVQVVDNPSA